MTHEDKLGEQIADEDVPSVRRVEAPNEEDTIELAKYLLHADELVERCGGSTLDGSLEDLEHIQTVLDSNMVAEHSRCGRALR